MTDSKNTKNTKKSTKDPTLYYFYSVGCGWCKKAEPIVDEINAEGEFEILKLDLADETNRQINDELKKKYDIQCGTPWFIDAETGNGFCGYREKDVVLKWCNGEEIPQPVRPTGPPPKPPLMGASKKEEKKWIEEYDEWLKKNEKLPNVKTSKEILEMPRPKSDPPKPPERNASDEQLDEWVKKYDAWKEENDHLPNLLPTEQIVQRFKQAAQAPNQPGAPVPGVPGGPVGGAGQQEIRILTSKIAVIENKLDRLLNHLGLKQVTTPPINTSKRPGGNENVKGKIKKVSGENVKTKSNKK